MKLQRCPNDAMTSTMSSSYETPQQTYEDLDASVVKLIPVNSVHLHVELAEFFFI